MAEIIYLTKSTTVGAGASAEVTYTPEAAYHWKALLCTERGGASLNNVHFQILIAGNPIIKDSMPLAMVGSTVDKALPIERDLGAGTEVRFKITNNTGSAITVDLTLILEKA